MIGKCEDEIIIFDSFLLCYFIMHLVGQLSPGILKHGSYLYFTGHLTGDNLMLISFLNNLVIANIAKHMNGTVT